MNDNRKQRAQIAPQSFHLPRAIIKVDQAPVQMFKLLVCKCSIQCAIIRAYQVLAQILNVKYKFYAWEIFARIINKGPASCMATDLVLLEEMKSLIINIHIV